MSVREHRELIYLDEGTRTEMAKLLELLCASGIRARLLPVEASSTHDANGRVELAVASEDHPGAVDVILEHWANG